MSKVGKIMDITIYWSAEGKNKGALERIETPYIPEWADWWVFFDSDGEQDYCVCVRDNKEEIHLAESHANDEAAYMDWLEENVDAIQINDYLWWQSSRVQETQE